MAKNSFVVCCIVVLKLQADVNYVHWGQKCLGWVILGWKPGWSSKFWPILDTKETLTDFHGNEAKKSFLIFFQNDRLKKTEIFKTANSQKIVAKISGIGSWVSRTDWCKEPWCGSTYMVERLSDVSLKTGKMHFLPVFEPHQYHTKIWDWEPKLENESEIKQANGKKKLVLLFYHDRSWYQRPISCQLLP